MIPDRELRFDEGEMLLVDKPAGWTSFDVVKKLRRLFQLRRIGHAGTLDPLATGLLIVCTGKKTKEISHYMGMEKEYEAEMLLGVRTASYDAATPVLESRSIEEISEEKVRAALEQFVGPQRQLPPMWSAVKVQGRRLYKSARQGIEVERKTREVTISTLQATHIALPLVGFRVVCSKGTYIRTLVNDIGNTLTCGAYLTGLRRVRIGPYRLEESSSIEELTALAMAPRGAS